VDVESNAEADRGRQDECVQRTLSVGPNPEAAQIRPDRPACVDEVVEPQERMQSQVASTRTVLHRRHAVEAEAD